jgi:hypothetical protein
LERRDGPNPAPDVFLKDSDGETVQEIAIDGTAGELFELESQIAMMVCAVRNGQPLTTTGDDGRWAVAMCAAAQRSVENSRSVEFSELIQRR